MYFTNRMFPPNRKFSQNRKKTGSLPQSCLILEKNDKLILAKCDQSSRPQGVGSYKCNSMLTNINLSLNRKTALYPNKNVHNILEAAAIRIQYNSGGSPAIYGDPKSIFHDPLSGPD